MDLPNAKDNLEQFKKKVKLPVYEISAMSNIGLDEVLVAYMKGPNFRRCT